MLQAVIRCSMAGVTERQALTCEWDREGLYRSWGGDTLLGKVKVTWHYKKALLIRGLLLLLDTIAKSYCVLFG